VDELEILTMYVPSGDSAEIGKPTAGGIYPPEIGVKLTPEYNV
jgi:hypothetical protein